MSLWKKPADEGIAAADKAMKSFANAGVENIKHALVRKPCGCLVEIGPCGEDAIELCGVNPQCLIEAANFRGPIGRMLGKLSGEP